VFFPIQYTDYMNKSTHDWYFKSCYSYNRIEFYLHWFSYFPVYRKTALKKSALYKALYKWRWLDYNKNTNVKILQQTIQSWRQVIIILLCLLHFLTPEIINHDRVNLLNSYSRSFLIHVCWDICSNVGRFAGSRARHCLIRSLHSVQMLTRRELVSHVTWNLWKQHLNLTNIM